MHVITAAALAWAATIQARTWNTRPGTRWLTAALAALSASAAMLTHAIREQLGSPAVIAANVLAVTGLALLARHALNATGHAHRAPWLGIAWAAALAVILATGCATCQPFPIGSLANPNGWHWLAVSSIAGITHTLMGNASLAAATGSPGPESGALWLWVASAAIGATGSAARIIEILMPHHDTSHAWPAGYIALIGYAAGVITLDYARARRTPISYPEIERI